MNDDEDNLFPGLKKIRAMISDSLYQIMLDNGLFLASANFDKWIAEAIVNKLKEEGRLK